ncbi:PREDICTED: FRIGIDA-like protein 3 [Nicotiana attenuata]|uniref:FRIGIDA-like protein n=1 Tax=Nicotiana attenuata TaxID=49451 RepID=A0A314KS35_NICAT|nr:PREDICTED: FRIGIDA-like protein 3 [Nicotiana attenuata]OIT32122.1 frigida-like protein 3 [Nicotiana attenuata]
MNFSTSYLQMIQKGLSAMEDAQSVGTLMDSTTSKIHQLQKAFAELESHRAITLNLKWKQLEEHFDGLQRSLKRRFTELEEHEKEFETKIVQSKELLEKRQAAVVAKEQTSLERLQEKRDAAVSAIAVALEKQRKPYSAEPVVINAEDRGGPSFLEAKPMVSGATENYTENNRKQSENAIVEVKSYPELVKLCQDMDSEGLHKFISDNLKNLAAVREEIPIAFRAADDPGSLVLDSLKGFYPSEVSISDAKKDANLLGLRRTCIMLMECLSILLTMLEIDSFPSIIPENVKERAKLIAEEWKPKLDELDIDANNGNSLEAHAFLQLLATFGINSNFNQDDLFKLLPMVSRRRQAADLCRSLGLSDRMPGVLDVLVSKGRHIDAVNLAFAFELTERFSPVSLLKSHLDEASKASSHVKSGNASSTVQNDVNEKELAALKSVIKCIEEHKLQEQYPVDPLQKRILQLEKAKADKKRATEVVKPQTKRPRANGVGNGPRVANVATDKNFYARTTDRYPQYVFDRPYAYPVGTDTHVPSFLGTTAYNVPPGHGNFFGNGYHYQAAYLH